MKLRIRLIAFLILAFISITGIQNANAQPVQKNGLHSEDVKTLIWQWEIDVWIGNFSNLIPTLYGDYFPEDQRLAIEDHSVNIIRGYENNQLSVVKQNLVSLIRDYELATKKFHKMGWILTNFDWYLIYLNDMLVRIE